MKRDIGAEILEGLEEIQKWNKSELEFKTTKLKLPAANDVTLRTGKIRSQTISLQQKESIHE